MIRTPLHRHQLARLAPAGWAEVLARPWDDEARGALAHWAAQGLPLVVTRQRGEGGRHAESVALGLPAPARWGRRRIGLVVPRGNIAYFDEFPAASQALPLLPRTARPAWRRLCAQLAACGAAARVYGSHGWQLLTGLDHLHPRSDLDLCLAVGDAAQADAACAQLAAFAALRPRLDGELVFDDGSAVAWREWCAWRRGDTARLLVKSIDGVALLDGLPPAFAEAA